MNFEKRCNSSFWLAVAFIFLMIGIGVGCSRSKDPEKQRPNVLLIVIDTARADHFGCYGYHRNTTPNIDRIAETGILFKTVYCQMPTTGPSFASIFTSLFPRSHGVLKNGWVLTDEYPTLAETLKKNGYHTACFISSFVLASKFGYSRGFDYYDEEFPPGGGTAGRVGMWGGEVVEGEFDQRGNITTQKVLLWLQKKVKQPFFLMVHYYDPHSPYDPPAPYADMFLENDDGDEKVARYDGEIRFVDHQVGQLLEAFKANGLASNTLVIIMTDHGEGLGQHGWQEHGMFLYDEQTRIVLIMSWLGVIPSGAKIDSVVQAVDVFPTIVDLLGLKLESDVQGASLAAMLLHPERQVDRFAFIQRRPSTERDASREFKVTREQYGIRIGDKKYIWAPREGDEELYNLTDDPQELRNIAGKNKQHAEEMRNAMIKVMNERKSEPVAEAILDEQTRKKLEALGYLQ